MLCAMLLTCSLLLLCHTSNSRVTALHPNDSVLMMWYVFFSICINKTCPAHTQLIMSWKVLLLLFLLLLLL